MVPACLWNHSYISKINCCSLLFNVFCDEWKKLMTALYKHSFVWNFSPNFFTAIELSLRLASPKPRREGQSHTCTFTNIIEQKKSPAGIICSQVKSRYYLYSNEKNYSLITFSSNKLLKPSVINTFRRLYISKAWIFLYWQSKSTNHCIKIFIAINKNRFTNFSCDTSDKKPLM